MEQDQVSVEITIEEKQALKALTALTRNVDNFEKSTVQSVKKADMAWASFAGNLAANLAGKAIGAVVNGFKQMNAFVGESIDLAKVQEDAVKRLNTALEINGDFTQEASADMQNFASSLQKVTRFGDEVIINQLALAKSFGATNEQAKAIVAAAADMSEALGIDLESATRNVSKTLGGYAGELGEVIPQLKNLTREQLQAGEGVKLLADRFGGTAQRQVNTFSGALDQLGNSWGDLKENVGFAITENEAILNGIKELNVQVNKAGELIAKYAPGIVQFFVEAGTAAAKFFTESEADSKFAKEGVKGLRNELAILEGQAKAIQENALNLPSFLMADLDETNQKIDMYKAKIAEVTAAEGNLVELRKGNADALSGATAALLGGGMPEDFVTAPAGESPRVAKEKAISQAILDERKQLELALQTLDAEKAIKEQEAILARNDLDLAQREQALSALQEYQNQKIDIELQSELEKNAKIADARNRELADQAAKAKASIAIAQNTAKTEQQINELRVQNQEKLVAGYGMALNQAASLARKGTNEQKALAVAAATINTYAAATRAYRDYPYPANIAVMATTIAAGLKQVSEIQKASYAGGGVVGGFQGTSMGNDDTTANVRRGEMMLNGNQQRRLFDIAEGKQSSGGGELVSAINNLASQPVVVQIEGREIARAVRNQRLEGFAV